jgi:hypothetical protein
MKRTHFLVGFAMLICGLGPARSQAIDLPPLNTSASSQEISNFFQKQFGLVDVKERLCFGHKIFTAIVDSASGTYRKSIYVYEGHAGRWQLLAYRASNSKLLRLELESDGIAVYTKANRKILFIPKDALDTSFDPAEQ